MRYRRTMSTFKDLSLARRLERTEGAVCASFIDVRAKRDPSLGLGWREIGGAIALFDGPSSHFSQSFGLGLFEPVTGAILDEMEDFFASRGSPVFHEMSPLAGVDAFRLLSERGYHAVDLTTVLVRSTASPIEVADSKPSDVTVRLARLDEMELWIDVAQRGWGDGPEVAEHTRNSATSAFLGGEARSYFAEKQGVFIGTAALGIQHGVSLMAGASVVPEHRGHGAQRAMMIARLRDAAACGADIAMMGALPGSISQTNAEKMGFSVAYTRVKWAKPG